MPQNATVSGSGHTVVQIVGDGNRVDVAGAVGLVLAHYQGKAFTDASAKAAHRNTPGYTATGRKQTAVLSQYNRTIIPFVGRDDLLQKLRAWRDDPAAISVHALTGAGGRGKTRLAVEFAAELRSSGWTAGFARQDGLDVFRGAGCRTRCTEDTLVIVDYAAAKAAELAAWLRALVNDGEPPQKLRLLLIERVAGQHAAWWRQLFQSGGLEGEAIADLLAPDAPLEIGPLRDPDERHAVFAAAFGAASDAPTPQRDAHLDRWLAETSMAGDPLFLAMAGLQAGRQGLDAATGLRADQIARFLARQELDRIGKIWAANNLHLPGDRPPHAHLAALASLCEGLSEPAAIAAIKRETDALSWSISGAEPARAAMSAALPLDGGIAPIQPDIIAEAAMIDAWECLPDRGVAAIRRAAAAHRAAVTRAVIRACCDFLIRGQKLPLLWLHAIHADASTLEELTALADALPNATVELREIAAALTQTIAEIARERNNPKVLAAALSNLSTHLCALGRVEEALAAATEAVATYRTLAETHPDAILSNLASALSNLANPLSALGRREDALAAATEAVATYRTLAEAHPEVIPPNLALALSNLSVCLSDLGRCDDALEAVEEAVATYRTLAEARPEAFLPDVATALNNLCNPLAALGRREDALVAVDEAVAIYRTLAQARPDAFLPSLASALNNLANRLSALGRREGALAAAEQAVATYRTLADARPDAFLPALAKALNNLSVHFSALGRHEDALAAVEAAVATYRPLAEARPDAFLPELAGALSNLANRLSALGRREGALAAAEQAVAIRRTLANARPAAFLPDLATSLGARGAALREFDPGAAAQSFLEGIDALSTPFSALPAAHASLMVELGRYYLDACKQAGIKPNRARLEPIAAIIDSLNEPEANNG